MAKHSPHELRILERMARGALTREGFLGKPVELEGGLSAVHHEGMGRIACPWGGCGVFPKGEVELVDVRTAKRIYLTPLSVHMIGVHGFYEGRGSRYRLEPRELCRVLRVGPHAE